MGCENQARKVMDRWDNEQIALAILDHAEKTRKGLTRDERDRLLFLLKHLRRNKWSG